MSDPLSPYDPIASQPNDAAPPVLSGEVLAPPPPPPSALVALPPTVVDSKAPPRHRRVLRRASIALLVLAVLVAAGGGILLVLLLGPPISSDTTQQFALAGMPQIQIQCQMGDVRVQTGPMGSVAVEVRKSARALTTGQAHQLLDAMQVHVVQSGTTLTITEQTANVLTLINQRALAIIISVPPQSNITGMLMSGNLTITGITGTIAAQVSAGNLTVQDVTVQGASQLSENAGQVQVKGQLATGATLDLRNDAGDISFAGTLADHTTLGIHEKAGNVTVRLPQTTVAHIAATVQVGTLSLRGWPIAVNRNGTSASATGATQPGTMPTSTITVDNSAGNIDIAPL
jgi:hypothetical protein